MNQSINLLFVMEVFQTSIVNFLMKASNLQFGLLNKQKVYETDYISKGIMENRRASIYSLKRAIFYIPNPAGGNGKRDI